MPIEIFAIFFALIIFSSFTLWRREHVISSVSDDDLIAELKRRAYARKLKAEAGAEVEELLKR